MLRGRGWWRRLGGSGQVSDPPTPPVLENLTLSASTIDENSPVDTRIGRVLSLTTGSTPVLTDDASGQLKLTLDAGNYYVDAAVATIDYEATPTLAWEITETLTGATGSPRVSTGTITVNDVAEGAGLAAPVLTQTSAAGANPLEWDAYYAASEVWDPDTSSGDKHEMRWRRVDGGAWTTETEQELTGDVVLAGAFTWPLWEAAKPLASGYVEVQERRARYLSGVLDQQSLWSTSVSDTITGTGTVDGLVAQEGDSITAWANGYADLYATAYPALTVDNYAVGGNAIADLEGRQATVLATNPEVLTVLIGANDLPYTGGASAYYTRLTDYIAPFLANGTKVVVCTVLPMGSTYSANYAAFNTDRDALNTLLRSGVGTDFDYLVDFDLTAMGNAANSNNTTYYIDGLHPTEPYGHSILYPEYKAAANLAGGLTNEVTQFTFTDQTNATTSTVYQAAEVVTITGIHPGESKSYSVTGGEVRKNGGAWGSTGGTVQRGDTLEVRGTSSGSASTAVDVTLTVGSVSDTFTITTAAGAAVAFTPEIPPAIVNEGFANNFHDFTAVNFGAGKGIVMVASNGRDITGVTIGGVACTLAAKSSTAAQQASIWELDGVTAGSKTVRVSAGAALSYVGIVTGTMTNATGAASATATKAYGYTNDPQATGAALTVSGAGGLGLAMVMSEGGTASVTWTTGTELTDTNTGTASTLMHSSAELAATGTPTCTGLAFAGAAIAAAAWSP